MNAQLLSNPGGGHSGPNEAAHELRIMNPEMGERIHYLHLIAPMRIMPPTAFVQSTGLQLVT